MHLQENQQNPPYPLRLKSGGLRRGISVTHQKPYIGKGVCLAAIQRLARVLDERHAHLLPSLKSLLHTRCGEIDSALASYRYNCKPVDYVASGLCRLIACIGNEDATNILISTSLEYPFIAKTVSRLLKEHKLPLTDDVSQMLQSKYATLVGNAQREQFREGLLALLRTLKSKVTQPARTHIESLIAIISLAESK